MLSCLCNAARRSAIAVFSCFVVVFIFDTVSAADRLVGIHSAQVMSQSMPWIAQEAGLFKKYDLDFRLVFIQSSPVATAATLNGDAEIQVTGAIGNVRAYVQGFTDLVFIGGVKNILTHSVLGKPEMKRPEDLRGKKSASGASAATRIISSSRRLRKFNMDASKDIQMIQTGGGPGDAGGTYRRQRRCGWIGRAGGFGRGVPGISLCHQRSRAAHPLWRYANSDASLDNRQARARDRPIHASHGGIGENSTYRQESCLQSSGKILAHHRYEGS